MVFESFIEANSMLLWSTFAIALVMGAAVNKTNFCTMGAVSDAVNMGDWGRMRAWLFAIAVALLGVTVLEASGMLTLSQTFPPYRGGSLAWVENLLGGLIFGVGMTLASGCGNKCLIRIGGGNIKSAMVLLVIGVIAYFMTNPFPGSDSTLYSVLFYGWTNPMAAVSLPAPRAPPRRAPGSAVRWHWPCWPMCGNPRSSAAASTTSSAAWWSAWRCLPSGSSAATSSSISMAT
jgi:uncharacterized membrane protein YedE/YeeE